MDSTKRFSNRVENYVKYRPSYPKAAIDYLYSSVGFTPRSTIADIGAGTGIFTRLLLERGSSVFAVEPNDEMRNAAKETLAGFPNLHLYKGTAEDTNIQEPVDFIVSAQAFHWFDRAKARVEFNKILPPGGKVSLIWNSRKTADPFAQAYEKLLVTYGKDYTQVRHTNLQDTEFRAFFKDGLYERVEFPYVQDFDFDSLKGRMLSSSYIPLPGENNYDRLIQELTDLFSKYNRDGIVQFHYHTEIYIGEV